MDEIKPIIKGEVLDDEETLKTYSKDASIFEIKPQVIVCPNDSEDIKKLVNFVNSRHEEHLSITPRSAGTCMSGGAINDSIVLDMTKHFNKIEEIGPDFALTQPGVFYRDFEVETLKKGLILPCYTASRDINTVGGMVGNNSAGEKTLSYGQTQEYVRKLKVILSDGNEYEISPLTQEQLDKKIAQNDFEGNIYRQTLNLLTKNYQEIMAAKPKVTKNSAGYYIWNVWNGQTFDLNKLLVGSQGTLGIVTEIDFRLVQHKPHSNLLVIFLHTLDNLPQVINKVLEYKPESFESYDDYTLKFALRFLPEVIKIIDPNSMVKLMLEFVPEMWMSITGGMPKLILLAEFSGQTSDEVFQKCHLAQEGLRSFNLETRITQTENEAKKYWTIRRQSFNLLRHHAAHMRTAPFIDDIIVKPEHLPEFLPKLRQILDKYKNKMVYTVAGHIGNGNFHIIPLLDLSDPETRALIPEVSTQVFDLVFEYKGSMAGEHNDGLIRGPYLEQMYGEKIYNIFKEVKRIFDPDDIFNPHKKSDATLEYSLDKISKTSL